MCVLPLFDRNPKDNNSKKKQYPKSLVYCGKIDKFIYLKDIDCSTCLVIGCNNRVE